MPFDPQAFAQALGSSPLFSLGIGMLGSGPSRLPMSFGQRLGMGFQDMQQAQQAQQRAQYQQLQQQALQQKLADDKTANQDAQRQQAARDAYGKTLSGDNLALYNADPDAYLKTAEAQRGKSPWVLDSKTGYLVNSQTGQFKAPTLYGNAPTAAPAAPQSFLSSLPAETQGYVPKVMQALGGAPAFDANGPTPQLLDAVRQVESGGNPNAVSPKGAEGAFQLVPATASSVGVVNPFDPQQAQAGATTLLNQLHQRFGNNTQAIIAAYNAGQPRVAAALARSAGVPSMIPGVTTLPQAMAMQSAKPAAASKPDVIQQRSQEFDELAKATDANYGPEYKQAYMETGSMPTLNPEASYNAAWKYLLTGQQQRLYGSSGAADMTMVQNMAAKIAKENGISPGDMESQAGREKALNASLVNIQKQGDVMDRQMAAMHNNMAVVNHYLSLVGNGNYKDVNALRNAIKLRMGNTSLAGFNTALNSVATDYGKIMSGSTGATGASDTELRQARELMDPSMSPAQIGSVFDALDRDTQGQVSAASMKEKTLTGLLGKFEPDASTSINGGATAGAGAQAPSGGSGPSASDIAYLKAHPGMAARFDAHFGANAAQSILGH